MPTYEYACDACGTHIDVVHGFNERGPRKCAECGSSKMRKVFHPAGIVLKGSGFYKTDSRSESRTGSGNGSSGSKAKTERKSEAKSESSSSSKPDSSSKSSD
ncbi:MAG: FmdB family transcriptional regulator [Acidimicrobiia bacterium]|nr:FmdB family transcriptional regulator [Acidimicrobiia bacterium]